MTLTVEHFSDYLYDVHGQRPFTWQRDLLAQVVTERRWPDVVDLPTASGKTSLLDIAVFALALDADPTNEQRWAPRRVFFVIDRQVVVDQAHERAKRVRDALRNPAPGSAAALVADRLALLSGSADEPVQAGLLRGGITLDSSWARRPDTPTLIASTVDQVGSRLLFRGYGVTNSMRPVHAGLVGADSLIILDEVHLSEPFAQTLRAVRRLRERSESSGNAADHRLDDRWHAVEMSGTAGGGGMRVFPTDHQALLRAEAPEDAILRRRYSATKPVQLAKPVGKASGVDPLVKAAIAHSRDMVARPHVRTLGVIVNRVATAREISRRLASDDGDLEVRLVTGRMRQLDRDDLLAEISQRVALGRVRASEGKKLVVVGTQCLEAGADYDFDGLVTECASLDALRQRFGRLDRDGVLAADSAPGEGVILARAADLKAADDPVYGSAIAQTWEWLSSLPEVDFGIRRFADICAIQGEPSKGTRPPERHAPVLLPGHLRAWAQTNPPPCPDPDISYWLHGAETDADVTVVWRADLDDLCGNDDEARASAEDAAVQRVALCPPSSAEGISLPVSTVRRWLCGEDNNDRDEELADVEGLPSEADRAAQNASRYAVSWSGSESEVIRPWQVRAGQTLVVPAAYGGIRDKSWDPGSADPVSDLATRAAWKRDRPVLRLSPGCAPDDLLAVIPELSVDVPPRVAVRTFLEGLDAWLDDQVDTEPWWGEVANALRRRTSRAPRATWLPGTEDQDPPRIVLWREVAGDTDSEPDSSTDLGRPVALGAHLNGVARWAADFATLLGIAPSLASDVGLAGRLHDIGKLDPRFQASLYDMPAVGDVTRAPLAKSAMTRYERRRRQQANRNAGVPEGFRHELLSVAAIDRHPSLRSRATDLDLVLHLVASHHGHCRPFAPPIVDDRNDPTNALVVERWEYADTEIAVSSHHGLTGVGGGVADRFWRLHEKYGPWGLAWLEGLLRLADHCCSAEEQQHVDGSETTVEEVVA